MFDNVIHPVGMSLLMVEKIAIESNMRHYSGPNGPVHGTKVTVAKVLGITTNTLNAKLELYEEMKIKDGLARAEREKRDKEFMQRARGNPSHQYGLEAAQKSDGSSSSQSSIDSAQEHKLSMPRGQEVEEMLPEQVTDFSSPRRGKKH